MSDLTLVCKFCYEAGRGFVRPEYEKLEPGAVQKCPSCGTILVFYSNMGKLDLGLIPRSEDNDYEIFPPP